MPTGTASCSKPSPFVMSLTLSWLSGLVESGIVILALSDILAVVESGLLRLSPNDNDCDNKIKLKRNISVQDCLLMLQSDHLPSDGSFLTFLYF